MMTMMTCNDKYLQAYTEHVPYLAGECWLPKSVSHEFTHHQFQFIKVSKSIFRTANELIVPLCQCMMKIIRFFQFIFICALDLSVISTGFRRRVSCHHILVSARTHTRWRHTRWCPRRQRRITPPWITITGSLFSVSWCRWRHLNIQEQNRASIISVYIFACI